MTQQTCDHLKDNGERCQSSVALCDCHGECWFHSSCRAEERREAQLKGGQATAAKSRKAVPLDLPLETLEDAKRWAHRAAVLVVSGEIRAQQAFAVCRAVKTWIQAHEAEVDPEEARALREVTKHLANGEKGKARAAARRLGIEVVS